MSYPHLPSSSGTGQSSSSSQLLYPRDNGFPGYANVQDMTYNAYGSSHVPYNPNSVYTPYGVPPHSSPLPPNTVYNPVPSQDFPPLGMSHQGPPPPLSSSSVPPYTGSDRPPGPSCPVPPRSTHQPERPPGDSPQPKQHSPTPSSETRSPPQQSPKQEYQPKSRPQIRTGLLQIDLKGHAWLRDGSSNIFVAADSLEGAMDGDNVTIQLHERTDGKLSGYVISINVEPVAEDVRSSSLIYFNNQALTTNEIQAQSDSSTQELIVDGVLSIDNTGHAFIIPSQFPDLVSIPTRYVNNARAGDVVHVQILPESTGADLIGKIVKVVGDSKNRQSPPANHPPLQSADDATMSPKPVGSVIRSPSLPRVSQSNQPSPQPQQVIHQVAPLASVPLPNDPKALHAEIMALSNQMNSVKLQISQAMQLQQQVAVQLQNGPPPPNSGEEPPLHIQIEEHLKSQELLFQQLTQRHMMLMQHQSRISVVAAPKPIPPRQNSAPQLPRQKSRASEPAYIPVHPSMFSPPRLPPMGPSTGGGAVVVSHNPNRPGGSAILFTSALDRLNAKEKNALKQQFAAIDKEGRGYIGEKELKEALGLVGFNEVLAKLFAKAFDADQDKIISRDDFMNVMAIMMNGTESEKLDVACNMVDLNGTGSVTKDDVFRIINSLYRVLTNMRIPVYETDIRAYVQSLWDAIDIKNTGSVTKKEYKERVAPIRHMFIGLGLVQVPADAPKLPKRGVAVSFGHFYWSLALQMMIGMRLATDKPVAEQVLSKHFSEVQRFELSSDDLEKKYIFSDYAPSVFKKLREMSGIDEKNYMYSLGPEQMLGNLLLGNLSSLSMSVRVRSPCRFPFNHWKLSEGKSGSFFFSSHDGRFLVKTISSNEKSALVRMLPNYFNYLSTSPHTMLCRIYGFHAINDKTFIVMGNVFSSHIQIDSLYDLKGSTVGRTSSGPVKRDLDFNRSIRLSPMHKTAFLNQIKADAHFLQTNNIIDYSLLLGIRLITPEEYKREESDKSVLPKIHGQTPFWAQDVGGMRGYLESGHPSNEVFFVGVIDILTEFGLSKKAESFLKSLIHDSNAISAVPADQYADRFLRFIHSLVQ